MPAASLRNYFILFCLVSLVGLCQVLPRGNAQPPQVDVLTIKTKARTVTVPANVAWTNTGITIQPGARLEIRYLSGQWSPWPGGAYDAIGFGGDPRCDCNVLAAVSHAALIGRIGDSQPFLVGSVLDLRTGESGDLYLGINDTDLQDNSGSIQVEVRIQAQDSQ